jgi:hypothetical protein
VKGSRALLPEFSALSLRGRTIEVVPDGDYETNPDVHRAVCRFADALREHGACPRRVVIPNPVEESPA